MATLKDASELTDELGRLVRRLDDEFARGGTDLVQLSVLADGVAEYADGLATMFAAIDESLGKRLADTRGTRKRVAKRETSSRGGRRAGARAKRPQAADEPTKTDLLEQAQEAAIPGRSSMSKEELTEAVESHEELTKEELVERARQLDIPGRSEMTKQQLLQALKKEESVSREELLERAKEADISGRSEMSKDELRQALQSS